MVVLAGADHAAFNTRGVAGELARGLAAPLNAARGLVWLYPLAALAAAVWLDRRELAIVSGRSQAMLRAERGASIPSLGLVRLALARPPWSTQAVLGFVRLRRAWLLSGRDGEPDVALKEGLDAIAPSLDRAGGDAGARVWAAAVERLSAWRSSLPDGLCASASRGGGASPRSGLYSSPERGWSRRVVKEWSNGGDRRSRKMGKRMGG